MKTSKLQKETSLYLFFGILTTIVNFSVFYVFDKMFGGNNALVANIIAFAAAVIFAYLTNKFFVFESKSFKKSILIKEIPSFLSTRILSFLFEQAGLWLCVDIINVGRWSFFCIGGTFIAKVILSFIAVILNYIFSKFFIFKEV